jgi:hypothetical protein
MADYLLIAPLIIGAVVGIIEFFAFMRALSGMGGKQIIFLIQAILFGSLFAFCSVNATYVISRFGLSSIPLINNVVGMQVAAGLLAAIFAVLVLFLMTTLSGMGSGMMTFKTELLFSLVIAALIFAAPYIAPVLSGITGGR